MMAKSYDYQSAFDIIGPVMMGPSSSHTAGAVKIGNSARAVLGDMPKHIEIRYYESFAKRIKGMVQTLLLSVVLWATALSIVELNHP